MKQQHTVDPLNLLNIIIIIFNINVDMGFDQRKNPAKNFGSKHNRKMKEKFLNNSFEQKLLSSKKKLLRCEKTDSWIRKILWGMNSGEGKRSLKKQRWCKRFSSNKNFVPKFSLQTFEQQKTWATKTWRIFKQEKHFEFWRMYSEETWFWRRMNFEEGKRLLKDSYAKDFSNENFERFYIQDFVA